MTTIYNVRVRYNDTPEFRFPETGRIQEHIQKIAEMPLLEEARKKATASGLTDLLRIIDVFHVAREGSERKVEYLISDCDDNRVVLHSERKSYAEMESLLKAEE